jgi:hypothetical protein
MIIMKIKKVLEISLSKGFTGPKSSNLLLKSLSNRFKRNPIKKAKKKNNKIGTECIFKIAVNEFNNGIKKINKYNPILALKAVNKKINRTEIFTKNKKLKLSYFAKL